MQFKIAQDRHFFGHFFRRGNRWKSIVVFDSLSDPCSCLFGISEPAAVVTASQSTLHHRRHLAERSKRNARAKFKLAVNT